MANMKIETGQKSLGIDNCIIISKNKGKLNRTEIAEALEKNNNVDAGGYFQIHVKSYDEIDPSIYDEGDEVILYPMDEWMELGASRLAPMRAVRSRHNKDEFMCPVCGKEPLTGWRSDFCPCCGQNLSLPIDKDGD